MTLKEKLQVEIMDLPIMDEVIDDIGTNLEYIAEDFALEFGKWLNNKVINPSGKHHNLLGIVKVDTLLVIFKKEKGL